MNEAVGTLDFMELGQAIQDAREKQRITSPKVVK